MPEPDPTSQPSRPAPPTERERALLGSLSGAVLGVVLALLARRPTS